MTLDASAESPALPTPVRLDKWLWAVRLYKTRSLAADACRLGRVTATDGGVVKPSRSIHPGDEFTVRQDFLTRRVRVRAVLERRVAARLVPEFLADLTPEADIEAARIRRVADRQARPVMLPGSGRPTKSRRRAMEAWRRLNEEESAGGGKTETAESAEEE